MYLSLRADAGLTSSALGSGLVLGTLVCSWYYFSRGKGLGGVYYPIFGRKKAFTTLLELRFKKDWAALGKELISFLGKVPYRNNCFG